MKRKLFLVLNNGSGNDKLPNVKADKENYLQFFRSSEGGAWEEEEIQIFDDNFVFGIFEHEIRFAQLMQKPYDFIIFVFCGHGYADKYGERWIEVRLDDAADSRVSVSQIKKVCANTRTLFISDACLAVLQENLNERRMFAIVDEARGANDYRAKCRELYNSLVLKTSPYTFTAGYAVSLTEEASDNERGGYYSQTLLYVAREEIKILKKSSISSKNHVSFSAIHEKAKNLVIERTQGKQHPSIEMPRTYYQIPFIVVPK